MPKNILFLIRSKLNQTYSKKENILGEHPYSINLGLSDAGGFVQYCLYLEQKCTFLMGL